MSSADFVREIRLRQWARRHYVPIPSRRPTWHPIVLDEMLRRDRELASVGTQPVETEVEAGEIQKSVVPPPHFGESMPGSVEAVEAGSRLVPLFPGTEWTLHPASFGIRGPHARVVAAELAVANQDVE